MLLNTIKSWLALPVTQNLDIDSPETTTLRLRIIKEKPFLRKLYSEWYASIAWHLPRNLDGSVVEIGSGGGFLKDIIPGLVTSEVLRIPDVDLIFDGHRLPFRRESLRGIVMLDVFHHLSRAKLFLAEASDCIKPDGAIIMIEPWRTGWSKVIYKYLHHETFDAEAQNWDFPESGPLSGANLALPWIIFDRDRKILEQQLPLWQVKDITLHTPFRYLLSGGVSLRSLTPVCSFSMWKRFEELLQPWMHVWAMFATIVLRRKD